VCHATIAIAEQKGAPPASPAAPQMKPLRDRFEAAEKASLMKNTKRRLFLRGPESAAPRETFFRRCLWSRKVTPVCPSTDLAPARDAHFSQRVKIQK